MPNGVMLSFDAGSGDGRIEASGRQYPVHEYDLEPRARTVGAGVHFDIERVEGVPVAVRVTAVPGTRTTSRQRRYGDLTGARRPDDKGRPPLTHQGGATDLPATGQPVALVRRWIAGADSGRLDVVLPLYAPDAVLHTASGDHHGRAAIRAFLLDSGLLTRGRSATPVGSASTVAAVRGRMAPDARRVNRSASRTGRSPSNGTSPLTRPASPDGTNTTRSDARPSDPGEADPSSRAAAASP